MGTHSLIKIHEKDTLLVVIYQQYDGYPSDVGNVLAKFLMKVKVGNGIVFREENEEYLFANGAGCLAAQFISHIKSGPGGVYIVSPDSEDEEWVYNVYVNDNNISVTVNKKKFKDVASFLAYCNK